ncbi:MAG: substrate-binding domain-containing protein [Thermoleophilaceae bacterium]|nr:substrate-binding domain-containing protein [Thermoleophilaceae bacterium]
MLSTYPNRALGRSMRVVFAALIALVAVAAFGAANSNAAYTAPYTTKCTGTDVSGEGASFQAVLQPALINYFRTTNQGGQTGGCGSVASPPNLTYTPNGSGAGRSSFGRDGLGRIGITRYAATDEPPSIAEETLMESAQGTRPNNASPATGVGKLGVAPVAAGPVAVIVNFPELCQLPAGDPDLGTYARFQVSNARMAAVWTGDASVDTWGEFLPGIQAIPNNVDGKTDTDCQDQAIKRVVRQDSSGTTFAFKHYLNGIDSAPAWLTLSNTVWPNNATVLNTHGSGNGALAQKVAGTTGSIGYGDLGTGRTKGFQKSPDTAPSDPAATVYNSGNQVPGYSAGSNEYSFNQSLFWIPLEAADATNVTGTGNFVEPSSYSDTNLTGKRGGNCATTTFHNVPLDGGGRPDAFANWFNVDGTLGVGGYPSCTLTYFIYWDDPADVYGNTATEMAKARTVRDFMLTSLNSGQNVLNANDYSRLPTYLKNGATYYLNGTSFNK